MDTVREYPPGRVIIEEGSRGTSAFIILSGTAEVFKKSGDREVTLATLGIGQVFGEMGLIEDRPRSASVRSKSELRVRMIDRKHFNHLLPTKPAVLIPIMKSLFERLRQASDMLAEKAEEEGKTGGEPPLEVILAGQTEEAKSVLDGRKLLITKFPFLVGRASLNAESDVFDSNDLAVAEEKPYVISRNHLAVVRERGQVWVVDRGSAFGTIVNGREIGGSTGVTRAPLDQEKNQVIIGPATSRYIYLLTVATEGSS
jgi:CRP/FNR family transcriptional regulator, cyclic AMP receptor protein